MRVSTNLLQQLGINAILEQQAKVSKTQLQIASGRRILTPADDPSGAARILELTQAISQTEQYPVNSDIAQERLSLEEKARDGVANVLQRVRELAIQGSNDTYSNEDREVIAREVRLLLDDVLALANTRDINGEYIFSGYQGRSQPFSRDGSGNFPYTGDDGQRLLEIGPNRQIAIGDSGNDVFRTIKNGNGSFTVQTTATNAGTGIIDTGNVIDTASYVADDYTISFTTNSTAELVYRVFDDTTGLWVQPPTGLADDATVYNSGDTISFNGIQTSIYGAPLDGDSFTVTPSSNQDIFTTVQNLALVLESDPDSDAARAQFHNTVNNFLADVDQVTNNLLETQARIGARLNTIDTQRDFNEDFLLRMKAARSVLEDLDFAEAISRFNLQLVVVQAAQQAFVKVQGLSLFNFLR